MRQNSDFDKLVLSQIFATPAQAEKYLLNRYRNKKIPAHFAEKDLIAWQMLKAETQERFLKYG